jgi:hypothetical protein
MLFVCLVRSFSAAFTIAFLFRYSFLSLCSYFIILSIHPFLLQYSSRRLPRYETSSSHLKGRDAWLVDRVNKEYAAGLGEALADLGYDVKKFQALWNMK